MATCVGVLRHMCTDSLWYPASPQPSSSSPPPPLPALSSSSSPRVRYFESVQRFARVLDASGINEAVRREGVAEGDTVIVGEVSNEAS